MEQSPLRLREDFPPPRRPDTAAVSHPADLDQTAWRQFAEASTPEAFYRAWLAVQVRLMQGVLSGVVVLGPPETGPFTPATFWPEPQEVTPQLTEVAERALKERRGLVAPLQDEEPLGPVPDRLGVAYPVHVAGRLHGVVAFEIRSRPERELQAVMRQLQWGTVWIEVLWLRQEHARGRVVTERLQSVLDLTATALSHERFYGAATAFVTALATGLDCDRVSLGFVQGGRVRVSSVSHSAQLKAQTNLLRAVAAAMDEAIDQQAVVLYPPQAERPQAARAHAELARLHGAGAICSLPLNAGDRMAGALTLERPADRPFESATVEMCEALVALAGPILEIRRREDRWLITKTGIWARDLLGKIVGPRHMALKVSLAGTAGLLLFLALGTGEYRVSATASLEPVVQRAVVAPFAGYIAEALVRAGDLVRRDQVLATLDDRELRLQRLKWAAQLEQLAKQVQQAQAQRNAAQIVILTAQMDQARAEVDLLDDQLGRGRLRTAIDGMVVSGDLSQSLRAPVERGQVLFEVAPLDAFRVVLQVDERAVADVRIGQNGTLLLAGFPHEGLPFRVAKITPVSTAREGRNYFRVEATLTSVPERLRPGMEGVGKIGVDRRRLIWIWTHEVIDWARLAFWSWLP